MTQMLLLPDPRPLVERLGADFFRNVPVSAGVYLMRDAEGQVLYVGKAKNLRNRLRSYRVANPDRMPRRHLRLLRAATSIELQQCSDETAALARESELLLLLRPRYNRAGTWPGNPGFLLWRATAEGLEMGLSAAPGSGCASYGPVGAGGFFLRAALVRLLWCVIWPERGLGGMPAGWFHGPQAETVLICRGSAHVDLLQEIQSRLTALFAGGGEEFGAWIRERASASVHPFESAVRDADLESLSQFLKPKPAWRAKHPRMDTN